MAILGLLLLAAATVVGIELAVSNDSRVVVELFGTYSVVPVSVVFLVGALLTTVALLGLFMITGTLQRKRHRTVVAKHRAEREETQTQLGEYDRTTAELVEENDRLRAELASERRAAATMGGVAVPPGAGQVAYGDPVSDAVRSDTISDTGRFDPYPIEHGNDSAVNTEAVRYDGTATTDNADDKAGVVGRFRGNS
jgi:uncharacterized membrane protein YciS (DUF1049 family)